jgi:hypothetical protein
VRDNREKPIPCGEGRVEGGRENRFTVDAVMRVDSVSLAPYHDYQIQFMPDLFGIWVDWDGGLFTPTDVTNSQFLFITNGAGFFRVRFVQ